MYPVILVNYIWNMQILSSTKKIYEQKDIFVKLN